MTGRRRDRPEYREQEALRRLYTLAGCTVYWRSQVRRQGDKSGGKRWHTGMTPGQPDLEVYHRGLRLGWTHEVKAPGWTPSDLSPAQREYAELRALCECRHLIGDLEVGRTWLRTLGLLRPAVPGGLETLHRMPADATVSR